MVKRNGDFVYKNYINLHTYNKSETEYNAHKDEHVSIDNINEIREITKEDAITYLTKPIIDMIKYIE